MHSYTYQSNSLSALNLFVGEDSKEGEVHQTVAEDD